MTSTWKIDWVDRLPATLWLALPTVALMPVWAWSAARLLDQSDDPLGIVALLALLALVMRDRRRFSTTPRVAWLVAMTLLATAAVVSSGVLPPLLRGVLAVFSVSAALMAVRAAHQPMVALTGLGLLALPLLSSLQFFVGYPLRVVTAEASRFLMGLFGADAVRSGSTLEIAGQLVMVDAPCSGVQMAWVGYFTACVAAVWWRVPDARFLRRLPLVGLAILGGNILRNTLLVLNESQQTHWPAWAHDAIGLAAFTGVCMLVLWVIARAGGTRVITWEVRLLRAPPATVSFESWARFIALIVLVTLVLWHFFHPPAVLASTQTPAVEWPRQFEGRTLRPLALSAVEKRFAGRFPGAIGRFTDGERTIVLRQVLAPTRMLHPATDCYRGLGYRLVTATLEQQASLWRCSIVEKDGRQLRVCEQIVDGLGQTFTDTSAWYWAAVLGQSRGPWQAVTKAVAI